MSSSDISEIRVSPETHNAATASPEPHSAATASPGPHSASPGKMRDQEVRHKVVIVIAGMARSGKSTALNNIFGTDFVAITSADSVTKIVESRRTKGDKGEIIIVDTPGFGATDLPTSKVKRELDRTIKYLDCVLIYCYSVSPNSCQSVADISVVKNLQAVLGKNIWKKCVVLFTFSDLVRATQEYSKVGDRENYKDLIRRHAVRFNEMLKKNCGRAVPTVKSVFDIDLDQEDINHIVGVPVGLKLKQTKEKHNLVPDIEDANWLDTAFLEIIRKADRENREVYLDHFHKKRSIVGGAVASGIGAGFAIGTASGVAIGAATLGFGSIAIPVGAVVGAVVGGAVGTTGALSVQKIRHAIVENKKKEMLLKLENAQLIEQNSEKGGLQTNPKDDKETQGPSSSTESRVVLSHRTASETGSRSGISESTILKERPDSTRWTTSSTESRRASSHRTASEARSNFGISESTIIKERPGSTRYSQ